MKPTTLRLQQWWRNIFTDKPSTLVLIGTVLFAMPMGDYGYLGNFYPYLTSYIHFRKTESVKDFAPLWIMSCYRVFETAGFGLSGRLVRSFGFPIVLAMATVLMVSANIISYFIIDNPVSLMLIYGIFGGFGMGLTYVTCLKLIAVTAKRKCGLYTGVMGASSNGISILIIGMTTLMINPSNKPPTNDFGPVPLFTDEKILDSVPRFFIMVGILTAVAQGCGLILVRSSIYRLKDASNVLEEKLDPPDHLPDIVENGKPRKSEKSNLIEIPKRSEGSRDEKCLNMISCSCLEVGRKCEQANDHLNSPEILPDYAPNEIVKQNHFWLFMALVTFQSHSVYVFSNLYKQYGALYIADDNFLTLAGSLGLVFSVILRFLFGVLVQHFGAHVGMACVLSACILTLSLLPIVFWLYPPLFIVLAPIGFLACLMWFDSVFLLTYDLFGPTHVSSNFGFTTCPNLLLYFIEPLVIPHIIDSLGLEYVFSSAAVSSFVGLLILMLLPDRSKRIA